MSFLDKRVRQTTKRPILTFFQTVRTSKEYREEGDEKINLFYYVLLDFTSCICSTHFVVMVVVAVDVYLT